MLHKRFSIYASLASLVFTAFWSLSAKATTCPVPNTVGVVICVPSTEDTVSSPVEISAAARGDDQLSAWRIYVDGISVWKSEPSVASIDPKLPMTTGVHRVTVKVWDINGSIYSQTIFITVGNADFCSVTVDRTVVICSIIPRGGRLLVRATAEDQRPLASMQLYVNGVLSCTEQATQLAQNGNNFECAPYVFVSGSVRVTVKAWDALGSFSATRNVFVP